MAFKESMDLTSPSLSFKSLDASSKWDESNSEDIGISLLGLEANKTSDSFKSSFKPLSAALTTLKDKKTRTIKIIKYDILISFIFHLHQ